MRSTYYSSNYFQFKQAGKPSSVSGSNHTIANRTAAIYLVPMSPPGSCSPPENQTRRVTSLLLFGLAFRWGLPCDPPFGEPGSLLHHLFTLTPPKAGRYIFCGAVRNPFLAKRVPSCYEASSPLKARTFLPPPPEARKSGRQACFYLLPLSPIVSRINATEDSAAT